MIRTIINVVRIDKIKKFLVIYYLLEREQMAKSYSETRRKKKEQ